MDNKEQLYRELARRLREEGPNANLDDLIEFGSDNLDNSRQTSQLLDGYVGSEMMKNSNVPIDLKNEKNAKKALERLTEQYTDIKNPKWDIYDLGKDVQGYFDPTTGKMEANSRYLQNSADRLIAHEPIHKMVNMEGGKGIPDNVMNSAKMALMKEQGISPRGNQLEKLGALAGHEIMQYGHLNPESKMTSSLKNALAVAGGKFSKLSKVVPYIGPAIAGLTALEARDANAAIEPLTDIGNAGPSANSLESMVEDPTKTYEQRRQAIERLSQQRGDI